MHAGRASLPRDRLQQAYRESCLLLVAAEQLVELIDDHHQAGQRAAHPSIVDVVAHTGRLEEIGAAFELGNDVTEHREAELRIEFQSQHGGMGSQPRPSASGAKTLN